jgi:hypothetical protein
MISLLKKIFSNKEQLERTAIFENNRLDIAECAELESLIRTNPGEYAEYSKYFHPAMNIYCKANYDGFKLFLDKKRGNFIDGEVVNEKQKLLEQVK